MTELGAQVSAGTILAGQAAHPCACVAYHQPRPAEYERHHVHPEAVQRAQGLTTRPLGAGNEWTTGGDLADEQAAYWVALCPTAHSAVHVLLRQYAAPGYSGTSYLGTGFNRLVRRLAAEGNRRVLAHGGWPA